MTAVMANPPGPSLIETLTQEASGNMSFRYRCLAATTKIDITERIDIEGKVGIGHEGSMPGALETGLLCLGFCPARPFTFFGL
ncbi:hypothetical protein PSCFBP2116_P300056 (plasmid) [Pseudomonas syringae]|nr:hypothetical protein PSCFBP2116_P300056 [Pseudomonas syringae]